MGVALSVLGNNNSSLIGVAISASLLPPAVNCGMALAFALFLSLSEALNSHSDAATPSSSSGGSSDDTSENFLTLAGMSFALTAINIVAIFLAALGMFRLKEVAPVVNKVAFWNEDVKLYRGLNKQQKRGVGKRLLRKKQQRKRHGVSTTAAAVGVSQGRFLPFSPPPPYYSSAFSSYDLLSPPQQQHLQSNRYHHRQHSYIYKHQHSLDGVSSENSSDSCSSGDEKTEDSENKNIIGGWVNNSAILNNEESKSKKSYEIMSSDRIDDTLNVSVNTMAEDDIEISNISDIANLPSSSNFQLSTLHSKRTSLRISRNENI